MDSQLVDAVGTIKMLAGIAVGLSALTVLLLVVNNVVGYRMGIYRKERGADLADLRTAPVVFGELDEEEPPPFQGDGYGPVMFHDWRDYGNHLNDCDQCGIEHARCDIGRAIYAKAKTTGGLVRGMGG